MEDSPRPRPYIWVSWLPGLLSGMDRCTWRVWMKAHFRYAKLPDKGGFDLAEWTKQHDAMVQNRAERLRQQGYQVTVEGENQFKIVGKTADLAGKADLIGVKHEEKRAVIIDEKSGKISPAHRWQVQIYNLAFRRNRLKDYQIDGEVEYRGSSEYITAEEYTPEVETKIFDTIKVIGAAEAPPRAPSENECRFCDVASCPERWKPQDGAEPVVVEAQEF